MKRQLVSFDWALKRLLRSKANFAILEGFLSELLREDIKIQSVLESETNKNHNHDKSNRVDLLVKNERGEMIIVEVQYEYEADYMQRILYGTSKVISENILKGASYENVKKVISVSIVYFDLGQGKDYVYWGRTSFYGLHEHDELKLNEEQKELYSADAVHKIFPEYYLLKVNQFNDVARDGLDEWIYFLKNDLIKSGSTAKGLKEASEELNLMKMTEEEQKAFEQYQEDLMYQASMHESTYGRGERKGLKKGLKRGLKKGEKIGIKKGKKLGIEEGKIAGEKIGIKKGEKFGIEKGIEKGKIVGEKIGIEKGKIEIVRKMKEQGMDAGDISKISGLSLKKIAEIV